MSEPISLPTERATGHELNRAVLADSRFSARYEIMHNPFGDGSMGPAPVCDLTGIDPAEHTRLRRLLTGRFTHRRMRLLADRVEEFAQTHLDAMQRHGPPVDLAAAYGQPIPALMICELLGVPYDDHKTFQRNTEIVMSQGAAMGALHADPGSGRRGADPLPDRHEHLRRAPAPGHLEIIEPALPALVVVDLPGRVRRGGSTWSPAPPGLLDRRVRRSRRPWSAGGRATFLDAMCCRSYRGSREARPVEAGPSHKGPADKGRKTRPRRT